MPVYQNGKRDGGEPAQSPAPPAQNTADIEGLLAQVAALTKGLAAAQGIHLDDSTDVDPAEALQRLAEAGAKIKDGKIVDGDIGDKDVVESDEKSRKTLDLLNDL